MEILRRVKQAWRLSRLPDEVISTTPNIADLLVKEAELGDGKAEFIGEGTHDDFVEQQRTDDGTKPWYERLKRLTDDPI